MVRVAGDDWADRLKLTNKADKLKSEKIHIALYPSTSPLFTAINDRLTRASTERV